MGAKQALEFQARILPTRNGNDIRHLKVWDILSMLGSYLQGMETAGCVAALKGGGNGSDPTYKEWKLSWGVYTALLKF